VTAGAILAYHWPRALSHQARGFFLSISMPSQSLFLALPTYGDLNPLFTQSLIKFLADPGVPLKVKFQCGDSLVSRARNTLSAQFLASDCTHLLFIDSDLIFSRDQVLQLLSHGKPVVGGFYPKKQDGELAWVCNAFADAPEQDPGTDLLRVRYLGTGFLLIERAVFEMMAEAYALHYTPDGQPDGVDWDFWPVGIHQAPDGRRRYLSEDWYFCQRWADMGGTIWADPHVVLRHCGHAIYPLQSQVAGIFPQAQAA